MSFETSVASVFVDFYRASV